jgi:hypothetical protein
MSSIMRWRNGLLGLSSIAKTPVSHGVEPHDLETGSGHLVALLPSESRRRRSPLLPRERFSPWVESGRLKTGLMPGAKRENFTIAPTSQRGPTILWHKIDILSFG